MRRAKPVRVSETNDTSVLLGIIVGTEMGREHFYGDEEMTLARLRMLQTLVGEQDLHNKPCPLLAAQLNEIGVLCGRLQATIIKMAEHVEKAAGA